MAAALFIAWRKRAGGWMRRKALSHFTVQQIAATRLYGRMLRTLESYGVTKSPSAAPVEFAGAVSGQWVEVGPIVWPLTELYCRSRFGTTPLSSEDLRWADTLLAKLSGLGRGKLPSCADSAHRRSRHWTSLFSRTWWKTFKE